MLKIDERYNITKGVEDWQNMLLQLFNVNAKNVKNVIMYIYGEKVNYLVDCKKFYLNDDCLKVFFTLDNRFLAGDYLYNIQIIFKDNSVITSLTNRGFKVYD